MATSVLLLQLALFYSCQYYYTATVTTSSINIARGAKDFGFRVYGPAQTLIKAYHNLGFSFEFRLQGTLHLKP